MRPAPVQRPTRRLFRSASGLSHELGGAASGLIVAVVVLIAVGVGAFYYFGGRTNVDVKIKKPDVHVSSTATPKS
jgi:hypothetical protein